MPKTKGKKASGKTTKKGAKKKTPAKKKRAKGSKKKAPAKKKSGGSGRPKKEGLRKPQVRILKAMLKRGKPMTRNEISDKAEVDRPFCTTWLGCLDPEKRKANEEKRGIPSLVGLGLTRVEEHDVNGKSTILFSLTAKGKTAAKKAE